MAAQTEPSVDACRAALKAILETDIFSGSRQLSGFLNYVADASLGGRNNVDQYEIAKEVLGRSSEFNPWDDATVRKLATRLRQKLEEYYAGPGAGDAVILSLPRRSYVPRFRLREEKAQQYEAVSEFSQQQELGEQDETSPAMPSEVEVLTGRPVNLSSSTNSSFPPSPLPSSKWFWMLVGLTTGAGLVVGLMLIRNAFKETLPGTQAAYKDRSVIVIHTARGDLRGPTLDVAADAVRTGPVISDGEEAITRLRFSPGHPSQQAGLMAMFDADRFVRLGDHFKNNLLMELGIETEAYYQNALTTYSFDVLAQKGISRWLAIRRSGQDYQAFVSSDGFYWRNFGSKLNLPGAGASPKAAVYAFNGRSNNPSEIATFDQFGAALSFHSRTDQPFRVEHFPAWEQKMECGSLVTADIRQEALQIGFTREAIGCKWGLTRAVEPGDWSFSALVDFEPVLGSSISLILKGATQKLALSRRDLGGGSLVLERADDHDSRRPDFPGAPPVILRFEKTANLISASASLDGESFVPVGEQIQTEELGTLRRIGISSETANWATPVNRPPARVYWIRQESLIPGTLPSGNVPRPKGT
jgi:hypothetical protein